MRSVRVANVTRGTVLAERAELATSFVARALGLMDRSGWSEHDGLLLDRCGAIHTLVMRLPIDVVFVRRDGTVARTVPRLAPWRPAVFDRGATRTLEVPAGAIERSGTRPGDRLEIVEA